MNTIVTKEFKFDCAHMLSNHEGLCANVHGHTYTLQVALSAAQVIKDSGHSEEGMLIDFSHLKSIVKVEVIDEFDHAFLTWADGNETEKTVANTLIENGLKVVILPYRTTCENMAAAIYKQLDKIFWGKGIEMHSIKLWETPTSYAEVTKDVI